MKILSIDAETNGLYGQIFAIGAVYRNSETGEENKFIKKVSIEEEINPWVLQNVVPQLEDVEQLDTTVDHDTYGMEKLLLKEFTDFYKECKRKSGNDLTVIGHMVCPVEANLFIKMRKYNLIEEFEGPYPLHDIASMMLMFGENPTSVDLYVKKYNLLKSDFKPHNPLFDAEQALEVFRDLKLRQIEIELTEMVNKGGKYEKVTRGI